jgi:hypothetical protein
VEVLLPTLAAALAASLAGWMIEDVTQPYLGLAFALVLSLACSTGVFYAARRWLTDLRGQ